MNPITTAEDTIITIIRNTLQNTVRLVDSLPGRITLDVLRAMAATTPAVYVAFLGGRQGISGGGFTTLRAVFGVYVVTDQASGNSARRRGDARQIGAYDLLGIVVPLLHGYTVPAVGTLDSRGVENLFSVELDKTGVAIYAATFELPMQLEYQADDASLADFISFDAVHSISTDPDVPTAHDTVTLET